MALLSGAAEIPHISAAATSVDFEDKSKFPFFGRTMANAQVEAKAARDLFQKWNATHLAVLYVNDPYGISVSKALEAFPDWNLNQTGYSSLLDNDSLEDALDIVQATQYQTIYVICHPDHYPSILEQATARQLMGPEHLWLFSGLDLHTLHQQHLEYPKGK
jgi:ABC-type branched-subunit amino acid transport system substrate-binding protein